MNSIQKTVLASLVAVGMGVVAVPATAATEIDDVLMLTLGYDVGGSGFAAGAPTTPAQVVWTQTPTGATNTLNGSIHFDGASNCAHVLLISFDENSLEIGRTQSADECPPTLNHFERPIKDLSGNLGLQGIQGASEVKVRLETNPGGIWTNARTKLVEYGPDLGTSEVLISASHFDFGTGVFAGGTAPNPATVTWSVAGANVITPATTGTLYMKNASNLCGRIRYTYKNLVTVVGPLGPIAIPTVLATMYSLPHCTLTDALDTFTINSAVSGSYSDAAVDAVEIAIEASSYDINTEASTGIWDVVEGSTPVTVLLPSAP